MKTENMIKNWKDTAFGSDFGGDFLELVENIANDELSIEMIYQNTDVKKYLDNPDLLKDRTDNSVYFTNTKYEQYIHFEDLIIALSAIIAESKHNGIVDLSKAYGSKTIQLKSTEKETEPIYLALKHIYNNPKNYILFEMCLEEERKETLNHISEILKTLENK